MTSNNSKETKSVGEISLKGDMSELSIKDKMTLMIGKSIFSSKLVIRKILERNKFG